MGTIASVLQWTCTNCNLINPTECLKCINCGHIRRIRVDRVADYDYDSSEDTVDSIDTIKHSQSHSDTHSVDQEQLTKSSNHKPTVANATATLNQYEYNNSHCDGHQTINKCADDKNTTNSEHFCHETLPGYVEINSNGYTSFSF